MSNALRHLRQNAIAYLALFVALGGTSYAAINLPPGSVGSRQLKNHSITPVKFDGRYLNAGVRAWAVVAPDGTVQASAGRPTVQVVKGVPNSYVLTWKVAAPSQRGCFALAGLTGQGGGGGSAPSFLFATSKRTWDVNVGTYGPQGQALAQEFYVALVC